MIEQKECKQKNKRNKDSFKIAFFLGLFAIFMLSMAYASVPLYKIFCQITGFGGTTKIAIKNNDIILNREIIVQFDANVSNNLPWIFKPIKKQIKLKIGETKMIFYNVKNISNRETRGTAIFNVTPNIVGKYFNKIECFCFTEQILKANQSINMPVEFFINSDYINDLNLKHINIITLSYTFYQYKE